MYDAPGFPRGPFTQADLDSLGIGRAALRRALAEHSVRRVTRGVYVPTGVADSIELRAQVVARVVAPGHVVCDRTAAWLYGVELLLPHELVGWSAPIETCALRGRRPTSRAETVGRSRDLVAADITEHRGLLVTTPLRTALDLGCILRRSDALAALDQFRARFALTTDTLTEGAMRYVRRRGVVQLRALIPLSDPRAESVRESWTRLAIIDAGLPAPVPQVEIEVDGRVLWRLDHGYPDRRIAVEYDGHDFHHTEDQRAHDDRRRTWLRRNGWTVIVVRRGDFSGRDRDRWIQELGQALRGSYSNLRW